MNLSFKVIGGDDFILPLQSSASSSTLYQEAALRVGANPSNLVLYFRARRIPERKSLTRLDIVNGSTIIVKRIESCAITDLPEEVLPPDSSSDNFFGVISHHKRPDPQILNSPQTPPPQPKPSPMTPPPSPLPQGREALHPYQFSPPKRVFQPPPPPPSPMPPPSPPPRPVEQINNEEIVQTLMALDFTREQIIDALTITNNDPGQALALLEDNRNMSAERPTPQPEEDHPEIEDISSDMREAKEEALNTPSFSDLSMLEHYYMFSDDEKGQFDALLAATGADPDYAIQIFEACGRNTEEARGLL